MKRAGMLLACAVALPPAWAGEPPKTPNAVSEAAVKKAVADYARAADELAQGGSTRSVAGPFKPPAAALIPAIAEEAKSGVAAVANAPAPNVANRVAPANVSYAKQANEARARGDVTAAIATWGEAEKAAQRTGDRTAVAQAALQQARLWQGLPATTPDAQQKRGAELIAKYSTAIDALPRPEQAFARNNLAVVYLQQRKYAEAAAVMGQVDWKAVEPEQLALCRYNFGRAEEGNRNPTAAIRQYRMALTQEPTFAPNVDALFRVLIGKGDTAQLADVGNELTARGEAAAAVPRLRDALLALAGAEKSDALVVALVGALAAAGVSPTDYLRQHAKPLAVVADKAPAMRPLIAELNRAYAAELPVDFSGGQVRAALGNWVAAPRHVAMSKLLQSVGDFHRRPPVTAPARERRATISRESAQRALASYLAAWAMDRDNTDGPVYAAAVLQEHRSIDENGALLGTLIDRLFMQKGQAIGIPVKSSDDLRNLMRLHLVLATIFEREKIWGPRWNARSAAFQFAHAIALEQQLREADPTFVASADLYARAARAYEEAKEPALALEFHTKAAEAYLFFNDAQLARQSRDAALKLSAGRDPAYQARLNDIGARLERL